MQIKKIKKQIFFKFKNIEINKKFTNVFRLEAKV